MVERLILSTFHLSLPFGALFTEYTIAVGGKVGIGTLIVRLSTLGGMPLHSDGRLLFDIYVRTFCWSSVGSCEREEMKGFSKILHKLRKGECESYLFKLLRHKIGWFALQKLNCQVQVISVPLLERK